MRLLKLILIFLVCSCVPSVAKVSRDSSTSSQTKGIVWTVNDLITKKANGIRIAGKPKTVDCKYGKAVLFNGSTDGIFLDQMPLKGLDQFTLEMILCPYSGGNFEQRFFHSGEVKGNRVLLELRSTPTDWYFDAFVKSGQQQKTLIDPKLLHPLDQWAHVAFVVGNGYQATYINGKKELESSIEFAPISGGMTSIGVRQNEQSWFRGEIHKIRISPGVLTPEQFLKY
jgi:hypothetical protein